ASADGRVARPSCVWFGRTSPGRARSFDFAIACPLVPNFGGLLLTQGRKRAAPVGVSEVALADDRVGRPSLFAPHPQGLAPTPFRPRPRDSELCWSARPACCVGSFLRPCGIAGR